MANGNGECIFVSIGCTMRSSTIFYILVRITYLFCQINFVQYLKRYFIIFSGFYSRTDSILVSLLISSQTVKVSAHAQCSAHRFENDTCN